MTLSEKVGQLNQRLYGWQSYEKKDGKIVLTDYFKDEVAKWDGVGIIYGVFRSDPWSGRNLETGLSKEEAFQVSHMIQTYVKENTRLGVPVLLSEECPHGHQAIDSLTTPVNYTSGASWNPELYAEAQRVVANELREKGAHLGLISTLDVSRDPRWGRTEESFSEDPYLSGVYTKAALRGLQGNDTGTNIASDRVIAVLKHFAGQGSSMGGHNAAPVDVNEREMKEIHLLPMREGVKSGAKMCMAAYNDFEGIPCHGSSRLLNDLLRDELGFDGAVMSDGCALELLGQTSGSVVDGAAWGLESGVDVGLWDNVYPYIEEAVLEGKLDVSVVDQAVKRMLMLKHELGLFEEATPKITPISESEKKQIAVSLAEESMVLLKNNKGMLPLNPNRGETVAVIGPNGNHLYNQLGDYSPFKREEVGSTVLQGIESTVSSETTVIYEQGTNIVTSLPNGMADAVAAAKQADRIILALGGSSARDFNTTFDGNGAALDGSSDMNSGENIDLSDISLPAIQVELVKALADLEKPMIGVLIQGRPHAISEVEDHLDAILLAGYPGEHGGEAIANVLYGRIAPTGKLAMSIPYHAGQLPVFYNYRQMPFKNDYFDGPGEAHYPLGYGLTYTDFEINNVTISDTQGQLVVSGNIKNIGKIRSAETIQVFIKSHHPRIVTRKEELRGFKKIWLNPGEQETFQIVLPGNDLTEYDESLKEVLMTNITVNVRATHLNESFTVTLGQ